MYKVLYKTQESVLVKMDISTFEAISNDINENIYEYEFIFDDPINASDLVNL